ncbi:hypothetical protein CR203_07910 [Salipaludibacillus neizhouensis]|uniref:PDZ domain-containing protein n=1 Tax=Salipaludibacillus neizhouensis TaxID=885475 RepID=A0A3A9KFJ6_9BACI|nr:hypothetical protein [Salipaludibacillus neizhouensis]RKL68393.1 hypothetical protein CR203_07910 [Salipaludibacillus neizhouensis]
MEVIGLEILKAVGRFFLHPLTYIFVIAAFWLSMRRVKRERKEFHTRVYDVIKRVTSPIAIAIIFGASLSVVILLLGIEVPVGILALLTAVWIVLLPLGHARWLSMTVAGSIVMFIIPFLPAGGTEYSWLNTWLAEIDSASILGLIWLLAALFLAESLLILLDGWKQSSPSLLKSKRGKMVGQHIASRLWYLPLFLLFPVGPFSTEGWWPLFELTSGQSFGLALFPLMLGFQAKVHSAMPIDGVKKVGKQLLALNLLVIGVAVAALFYPVIALAVPALVLIGRECVYLLYRANDKRQLSMFTRREEGLKILGVLPHSTASKMGLQIGEIIWKTNGLEIASQAEFYHALQQNPAFCKLEIIDLSGEKRFAQSSIFQGDHYQIGCLFVPDDEFGNLSSRALRSAVVIQRDRSDIVVGDSHQLDQKESELESVDDTENVPNESEAEFANPNEEVASSIDEVEGDTNPEEKEVNIPVTTEREKQLDVAEDLQKKEGFFDKETKSNEVAYGQAAGLSAFYEEFLNSKPAKNTWTSDFEEKKESDAEHKDGSNRSERKRSQMEEDNERNDEDN